MATESNQPAPDPGDFTDPSPNPDEDHKLASVCDALQTISVKRVVIHYDISDYDCSFWTSPVSYEPKEVTVPKELDERVRNLAQMFCPDGYEEDDGGEGSLTVNLLEGLAESEYTGRYVDTEILEVDATSLSEELRQGLPRLGITTLTACFDGHDKDGRIEEYVPQPEAVVLSEELEEELQDFLLGLLPSGWARDEGSFGKFTVDVATGLVEVDARWRFLCEAETKIIRWCWR
jgi:hypothetical protein